MRTVSMSESSLLRNGMVISRFGRLEVFIHILGAVGKSIGVVLAILAFCTVALIAYLHVSPLDAGRFQPAIQSALNNATDNRFEIEMEEPTLQFRSGRLAMEAKQVVLRDKISGDETVSVSDIGFHLRPLALLSGRVSLKSIEISEIRVARPAPVKNPIPRWKIAVGLFGQNGLLEDNLSLIGNLALQANRRFTGLNLTDVEIDRIVMQPADGSRGTVIEKLQFEQADADIVTRISGELTDLTPNMLISGRAVMPPFVVEGVAADPNAKDTIYPFSALVARSIVAPENAAADLGGDGTNTTPAVAEAKPNDGFLLRLSTSVPDMRAILPSPEDPLSGLIGMGGAANLTLELPMKILTDEDNQQHAKPLVSGLEISVPDGTFRVSSGLVAPFVSNKIGLKLEPETDRVEILPSQVRLGEVSGEVFGTILVSDRSEAVAKAGHPVFELISSGFDIQPSDKSADPVRARAKFVGGLIPETIFIKIDELLVSTDSGRLVGSGNVKIEDPTPSLVFNADIATLSVEHLKAIWPPFIAGSVQAWIQDNINGGSISNAKIEAAVPAGILGMIAYGARMKPEHLNISVDVSDMTVEGYQDIPNIRSASGRIEQFGMTTDINVDDALFWLRDGEKIKLDGSAIQIKDFSKAPLSFISEIRVSGDAMSIANLAAGKPLRAFEGQPLQPEDFKGDLVADIVADIVIDEAAKVSARPDWQADLQMKNVDITRKIEGYAITDTDLAVRLTKDAAIVSGDAKINGLPSKVALLEGFTDTKNSSRKIRMVLNDKARRTFGVDLTGLVDGAVVADIVLNPDGTQNFEVDLKPAKLSVPGIGWAKGVGVPGKATFKLSSKGSKQIVSNLVLTGGGLNARGNLTAQSGKLQTLNFSTFGLNKGDKSTLTIKRNKGEYVISLNGSSFDMRPFVERALTTRSSGEVKSSGDRIQILGKVGRAVGFNKEALSNASFAVRGTTNSIDWVVFDAATNAGGQIKVGLQPNAAGSGDQLSLTTNDLGSALRFSKIYKKVIGGNASVELVRPSANAPYVGAIRVTNITIVDEPALKSLVNSKNGGDRSLNQSLNQEIPVDKFEFSELVTEVTLGQGSLFLNRGTIRGPFVGSTFSGTVYDQNNNMKLKGVFIPAYGINQLVSALPIIGQIFGRAASGGFLGVSWSLQGKFTNPRFNLNPLSIFTPGIFREIFN